MYSHPQHNSVTRFAAALGAVRVDIADEFRRVLFDEGVPERRAIILARLRSIAVRLDDVTAEWAL